MKNSDVTFYYLMNRIIEFYKKYGFAFDMNKNSTCAIMGLQETYYIKEKVKTLNW